MPGPDPLADRLAAADVVVRYASCIDERDWDRFRTCFAADVEFHGFDPAPIRGIDAWMAFVDSALARFEATQHLLGPPQVTLAGDRAELRTDLQAQHFYREPEGRIFTLWGTYRSSLVREADGWRIRRHALATRGARTGDPFRI